MARPQPTQVRALALYRIWVRLNDGVEGAVDLAYLHGKGVFRAWDAPGVFDQVFVSSESGTVTWPGEIDLDPDVLYSQVTGTATPPGDTCAA